MSIDRNSYGSTGGVAALTPRLANSSGVFDTTTTPTLLQVQTFLDEVSGMMNIMLAEHGFVTPVVQPDCVHALDLFVNQESAAMCEGVRGSGRFGPGVTRGNPKGRFTLMSQDVRDFLSNYAAGFERLGAARAHDLTSGVAFRDTAESGESTFPLFQRSAFGDDKYQQDWDN
jgi:hypothetical protein